MGRKKKQNYSKTTLKTPILKNTYYCSICDYTSSNNSNYKKHLRTKKHLAKVGNVSRKWQNKEKISKPKYFKVCKVCNYNAPKKYNWDKHIETTKHKRKMMKSGEKWQKVAKVTIV